jgi:hypothetical protein
MAIRFGHISTNAVEDGAQTLIKSKLVFLGIEFDVDEGELAPFGTADQGAAVLGIDLLHVE